MLKSGLFFSLIKKLRLLKYFLLKSEAIFCKKEDITLKVLHYLLVSHWAAFKKKIVCIQFYMLFEYTLFKQAILC